MQNVVFTVELLANQQVILKEKEMANADLQRRVDILSAEKRETDEKLARLTWTTNWWPNEAERANWIGFGQSSM